MFRRKCIHLSSVSTACFCFHSMPLQTTSPQLVAQRPRTPPSARNHPPPRSTGVLTAHQLAPTGAHRNLRPVLPCGLPRELCALLLPSVQNMFLPRVCANPDEPPMLVAPPRRESELWQLPVVFSKRLRCSAIAYPGEARASRHPQITASGYHQPYVQDPEIGNIQCRKGLLRNLVSSTHKVTPAKWLMSVACVVSRVGILLEFTIGEEAARKWRVLQTTRWTCYEASHQRQF